MRNQGKRTAQEWRDLLEGQRERNQRDGEYAQSVGVSVQSLRAWRQKVKTLEPAAGTPKFVEVTTLVGGPTYRSTVRKRDSGESRPRLATKTWAIGPRRLLIS